ncbi:MAG: NnrS family protein [Hylemonella sp.]|jgi:uncharacterized protein involved in response to NO
MKSIAIKQDNTTASAQNNGQRRWRAGWLLAAPHRLGFFAAALMLALTASWWALVLAARARGWPIPWAVAPAAAHGLLMSQGFMPLFMAGFLFTAGPKWLDLPPQPARRLLTPVLVMLSGWALTLAGIHVGAVIAALGCALVAAGWSHISALFAELVRRSRVPDRVHATLVAACCAVGALALWLAALALALESAPLLRAVNQLAIWGFVAPVFAVVSHRMIPFFTAAALPPLDAWRPLWLLWTLVLLLWMQGLVALAESLWWPLPAWIRGAQAALEALAAVLLLALALRWGLVQSLRIRLLAMLHVGFVWLGLAFALAAIAHLCMALGVETRSLGLAPLHALTLGYLGGTLLAMATRVSAGHGGRPLAADDIAWTLYWIAQLAALLRVLAELVASASNALMLLAAGCWAVACCGWALRYGRWFGRPRADGRPG